MAAKLGVEKAQVEHGALLEDGLQLLAVDKVDYTIFWRRLSHWARTCDGRDDSVRDLFMNGAGIDRWLLQYSELLAHNTRGLAADLMLKTNPKFVLRNHLGEIAIQAATQKDFSKVGQLLQVLERPFDEHPELQAFADFPPDWAGSISISCSS
jgi:uncharacterized protein YdiU (UPF0061 family)